LIVADNVLQGRRVVVTPPPDAGVAGIQDFNRRAAEDPKLDSIIVPTRDGWDGILIAVVREG
jgi:predicted O-methyltransferase YrrM